MFEEFFGGSVVVPVIGLVLVLFAAIATVVSRYKIAKPDEAIIITGSGKRDTGEQLAVAQKVVQGGGVFVLPFVQQAHRISLSSRKIQVNINAISQTGIQLEVVAVAIVKIGSSESSIRASAQRFLGQQREIENFSTEVLAGSLRSIVGTLTVDQIIQDRAAFASKVVDESESSMASQGLVLDTFQIQEIGDDGDYLRNLGRPEAAEVKRKADIAEANAERESESARITAQQAILDNQREYDLREAEIKKETDAAKAAAAEAGPREEARARQNVLTEEHKVAQRQAELREQELNAEVRKQAEADRYAAEQAAEAGKAEEIARAQGDAERVRLAGQADLDRRRAEAEAVRAEGDAEGAAIRAKGEAEAEAMNKKAEAYARYGQAAILDTVVAVLPDIIREASQPIENIDKLTVIDSSGASKVVQSGLDNATQGLEVVKQLTGVDLSELVSGFTQTEPASAESSEEQEEEASPASTDD